MPLAETVRIHASSGTRGKSTIVAYTAADIALFAELNARAIAAMGGRPGDVLHNAYGYGLFTGGLGIHYGGERLGATVVPASGGNVPLQLELLADLGATGLACTPSFALLLAERAGGGRANASTCATASSAPSPGRRQCAPSSRRRGGSTPATCTVSRR